MGLRETPFGDRGDTLWLLGSIAVVLYGCYLAVAARWGVEGAVTREDWTGLAGTAVLVVAGGAVLAYLLQRDLVGDLAVADGDGGGDAVTGRSVVEGRIAPASGELLAPVVDDRNVARESDGSVHSLAVLFPGWEPDWRAIPPDGDAPTRWYDLTVQELYYGLGDNLTRSRRRVGTETHTADPLVVDADAGTVDLTDADLSFPQGEYQRIRSRDLTIDGDDVAITGLDEALTEGEPTGPAPDPSPAVAGAPGPGPSPGTGPDRDANDSGRNDRPDTVTGDLLERVTEDDDASLLRRLTGGDYEVDGRAWPAATGEQVYVVGEFERRDGRLVPLGEVTVGRGRFADRLAEERARLARWRRRAVVAVMLLVGWRFVPVVV